MRRLLHLLLILAVLLPLLTPLRVSAQSDDPAQVILDNMTPAERVGQLFIVSFVGENSSDDTAIAQLIREDKVGGVVILAANQNFTNDENAPSQVTALTQALQSITLEQESALPLLVAIDQEGDGWPYTRLTGGMTPLPSPMAVGATWNPDLAHQMGEVTGRELAAVGINFVLGPSIDVLNSPRSAGKGDLGTRVFGGDPYWVGQMGREYIAGIHEGSGGRIATVAKHFPGHGGSDRLPDEEVATVDKSLQELRRIELAPFFAVTHYTTPDDPAVTDALMSSHIRYRGFQGNIRQFTAPISFDPQGLRTILAEAEFDQWRDDGVIVSDSLGVPAVKKYYDVTGESFPHRQIARDALFAGNDLLILAQYALEDSYDAQLANMRDTLVYFREQYESDRVFASRVDEAVLRVIRLKLKLYPEFANENAELPALPIAEFGAGLSVTEAVAQESLTLLYPRTVEELNERLPRAPLKGEPIVIFTDVRRVRDCFDCDYYPLIPSDALQQEIMRRYGPEGTGQIGEQQIISFSFDDLKLILGDPAVIANSPDPEAAQERANQVRALMEGASWILLVMQDINLSAVNGTSVPRYPESDAARLLLDAAAGSLVNKRVVAFAFNVPYQLDTTEVSKLSAAYALYSKQDPFIEVAARVLFKEITPTGAPPVSVEGINYDLPIQMEPAPNQGITLTLRNGDPTLRFEPPMELELSTSVIMDRNGHPVPDGTQVEFVGTWQDNRGNAAPRVTLTTLDGIAQGSLTVRDEGQLDIRVVAVQAESAEVLTLTFARPTPTASPTEPPTPTPRVTASPSTTALISSSNEDTTGTTPPAAPLIPAPPELSGQEFGIGLLGTLGVIVGGWWFGMRSLERRIRSACWSLTLAMTAYSIWGLVGGRGMTNAFVVASVGAIAGVIIAWRQK
jgi:beta-N-acetylhexosaminidase